MDEAIEFEIDLDDGRIARCWKAQGQPYKNCEISAGLVEGIGPDTVYLHFEKDGQEPVLVFMRPDEMQAVAFVCNGALWSAAMQEMDKEGE